MRVLSQTDSAAAPPPGAVVTPPFGIAIVEDEELERRALRTLLERNLDGIRIVGEARSGAEAVRLIDSEPIDLMLLDIKIPRPDGLEIIRMVRARRLATKVIIITAYDYFEIMQQAIQCKADGFLLKPVRTDALLKAVNDCRDEPVRNATPAPSPPAATAPDPADLGRQLQTLVDEGAYRACLALVRQELERLFARATPVPRHAVLHLAELLTDLATRDGRDLPEALRQPLLALETQRLEARHQHQVQEVLCAVIDRIFRPDGGAATQAAQRIGTILDYIERNLHKGVTLEDAAAFAHVSPCYLSRLFSKAMTMTFIAYLTGQRMQRAKRVLADSDLPIVNIALDLSYADANYFCKAFKKEVGVSPSEFRRRVRRGDV